MLRPRFTREGFELRYSALRAALGANNFRKLLGGFIIKEKPQPGAPASSLCNLRIAQCFLIDTEADTITFPRRFGHVALQFMAKLLTAEERALTEPPGTFGGKAHGIRRVAPECAEFSGNLYPYQEYYVSYICERRLSTTQRQNGTSQVYVHVGTGRGKTVMAMAVISRLRVPTIVIVPTRALQDDGYKSARRHVPKMRAIKYSNADDRKREKAGLPRITSATNDVVYCVINTAREKPPEFFAGYGLIIFDEGHEYQSRSSFRMMWTAQVPCVMALSASPDERADGMDALLYPFWGKPLKLGDVVPPDLIEDINFEGRVREVRYTGHPDYATNVYNEFNGTVSPMLTIGKVISDPHRFEMVAAEVKRLLELHATLSPDELEAWGLGPCPLTGKIRKHSVFVFAELREYLPALRKILEHRLQSMRGGETLADLNLAVVDPEGESSNESGAVVLRGGVTDEERLRATQVRLVLTTYGFSRRGISLAQMTAAVFASPRKTQMNQILGRICRLTPDLSLRTIRRVVVDVVDKEIALSLQARERRKAYKIKGWPCSWVATSYTQYPASADEPETTAPGHEHEAPVRTVNRKDKEEPPDPEEEPTATLADLM